MDTVTIKKNNRKYTVFAPKFPIWVKLIFVLQTKKVSATAR